jgi:mono/diheme cytochrome c family protein
MARARPRRGANATIPGALALFAVLWTAAIAQTTRSVWDGVYTEQQANRGAILYEKECAGCHGPGGAGGSMAPALTDAAFAANYDGQTVGDLFERNRVTMPVGREGQLTGQAIADITAFMLQANKFPAGSEELATQAMPLRQIRYEAQKPQ